MNVTSHDAWGYFCNTVDVRGKLDLYMMQWILRGHVYYIA